MFSGTVWLTRKRRRSRWLLSGQKAFVLVVLALGMISVVVSEQTTTPQDTDRPTVVLNAPTGGTLANQQIAADWQIHDGHLTGLVIRDLSTSKGKTLDLNGPFSLEMRNGNVLRAQDLALDGPARVEHLAPEPGASRYSERLPGIAVHYQLSEPLGLFHADWSLILREGSRYIRQSLVVTAGTRLVDLSGIIMIDARAPGISVAGIVKGSPLVAGDFFLGFEEPLSQSSVVTDHGVSELQSAVPLQSGQSSEYSAVVGVAPDGQMRRSFLTYLERERAHPYRTFLHYNSWFDIGFFTPYSQQDALNRIHAFGAELNKKRSVTLDSFLFDDGWDDHNRLWRIRSDFKDGFEPLKHAAAEYGTAPGVWLSPWGGYGRPKQERLTAAKRDGYEIVKGGLALSGPKYYARFHEAATEMVDEVWRQSVQVRRYRKC